MNLLARLKAAARVVWRGTLSEATEAEIFGTPVPWSEFFTANGRPLSPVARVYGPETRPEKNATLRTLQDHDLARNRSRVLAETNPNAIGLLQRVLAYVVGRGSSTEVQSAVEGQDPPKRLSKRVSDFVKKFKSANGGRPGNPHGVGWVAREKEIQWRLHVDGEFFLRFFPQADGLTKVRFVEPGNVRPPLGEDAEGDWSYGVFTPEADAEEPTHYCVHNFATNEDEIVEAHFIIHGKINCLSNQKRGVPSLYACEDDLVGAAKLRHATREGEKNRASINYFRRHKAASEGTVRAFRESQARAVGLMADPSAPDNASQVYVEVIQPGSTIDIPEGLDPLPPPGSPNVQGSATSVEQAMEAVAARFGVPVWVVSGKTDQGNFAQSLVVESPFTVTIEDAQSALAEWSDQAQTKAIEIAIEQGLLPEDVLEQIDLMVSFPSPVSRNQSEQTQRFKTLRDNNIVSERTWSVEEGFDPDKERQQIIEERKDAIGYIPSTIREIIRPAPGAGTTQLPATASGTPAGDAQAKAAGNGTAPSATPAARYAQLAGRLREQAQEFDRLAEAEWNEEDHPRGQPENAGEFGPGGGGASKSGTGKQAAGAAKSAEPATKPFAYPPGYKPPSPRSAPSEKLPAEARPALTAPEASALDWYAADGYRALNAALYQGSSLSLSGKAVEGTVAALLGGRGLSGRPAETHRQLQSAFGKADPLPEPVEVTRGLSFPSDAAKDAYVGRFKEALASGGVVQMAGYQSTTVGAGTKGTFENSSVTLQIAAVKGLDVAPFSLYHHESELLLDHDSAFRVHSITQDHLGRYTVKLEQLLPA